jgi:RsiW-degrading membrane proteinase PrsW (M82 family)
MNNKSLKLLAVTFALGGFWDTIAGILYIFSIGTDRKIDNPPIDSFFAIFLGSFFLCFAYL